MRTIWEAINSNPNKAADSRQYGASLLSDCSLLRQSRR